MTKNPIFEFLHQHGANGDEKRNEIPIVGQSERRIGSEDETRFVPPFSYHGSTFLNESAIVDNILGNPHPTDVLADSSLFSQNRLDLIRHLLISRKIGILPVVHAELTDLKKYPRSSLQDLVFPDGTLNPRLELLQYPGVKGYRYVTTRYTNLLHFRKRLLEKPLSRFAEEHGREAAGKERTRIIKELADQGVSWRTLRLANKGDARRRYTDEALVVYGVLAPILTGRDCIVLTADKDVFDQFFQFTQLLHDDYGSYLIAEDYRTNRARYKHLHTLSSAFMQPGATAVGRAQEPAELLPRIFRTCAAWVIDVQTLDFMSWVATRELTAALDFQENAADGRVGDGGDGQNVHMSLRDATCRTAPAHFAVGRDVLAVDQETEVGRLRISNFDIFRVVSDRKPKIPRR